MERKYEILFFIVNVVVEFADFVNDWLFYVDLEYAETGLVYGKPSQAAVKSLLVFTILGSICFIFEVINLGIKLCTDEPIVNIELVGALVVWLEDLPQLVISIYLASCREEAVSVFQISKAVFIVMSIILRCIFCIVKCLKTKEENERGYCLSMCSLVVTMIGLLLALGGAITIFMFTQAQRDLGGNITINEPKTVLKDSFNDQRYFRNVGIFVSHPAFNTAESANNGWMHVTSIDSVRDHSNQDTFFMFAYHKTDQDFRILFHTGKDDDIKTSCYRNGHTSINSIPCLNPEINTDAFIFKFTFIPPEVFFRKMIFGDIKFNIKRTSTGKCRSMSKEDLRNEQLSVHYFRTEQAQNDHLVQDSTGPRFYQKGDLTDVRDVWKTGFFHCEASGNLEPKLDNSITVPCEINTQTGG